MSEPSIAHVHHGVDYIEIAAPDLAAAKDFYGRAFGWAFTDYGPDYVGIKDPAGGGRELGGLCKATPGPGGGPLVILYSRDLEATFRDVVAAGATITKEPFSFPGGRRFEFKDPAGNVLGVWS